MGKCGNCGGSVEASTGWGPASDGCFYHHNQGHCFRFAAAERDRLRAENIAHLSAIDKHRVRVVKLEDANRELREENERLSKIIADCLREMPCGNIATHTAENLPGRIRDMAAECGALNAENERLKAALEEVANNIDMTIWHMMQRNGRLRKALEFISTHDDIDNIHQHAIEALAGERGGGCAESK